MGFEDRTHKILTFPILLIFLTIYSYGQSSSHYSITSWSLSSSGGSASSESYLLKESSAGGFIAGSASSDSYKLEGGIFINLIRGGTPTNFLLQQNFPNPFNSNTTIQYSLKNETDVMIQIFNSLGQLTRTLVSDHQDAGYYQVYWDGKDDNGQIRSSGIYYYRINTKGFTNIRKMILIK